MCAAWQGAEPFNLGTGVGVSVLEMVEAFGVARGEAIPYVVQDRRPGDVAECYADASKAAEQLGWRARCSVEDMCRDVLEWTRLNPEGFGSGVGDAAAEPAVAGNRDSDHSDSSPIQVPPPPPLRVAVANTRRVGATARKIKV